MAKGKAIHDFIRDMVLFWFANERVSMEEEESDFGFAINIIRLVG